MRSSKRITLARGSRIIGNKWKIHNNCMSAQTWVQCTLTYFMITLKNLILLGRLLYVNVLSKFMILTAPSTGFRFPRRTLRFIRIFTLRHRWRGVDKWGGVDVPIGSQMFLTFAKTSATSFWRLNGGRSRGDESVAPLESDYTHAMSDADEPSLAMQSLTSPATSL